MVVLVAGLAGCNAVGPGVEGVVDLAPAGEEELRLTYLGTGGWIMEHQGDQILAAPFFSNPAFLRAGLWTIEADTTEIDRWMSRYDVREARLIVTGHAHYDHLMDVPRVAHRHAPSARILGSATVANTLGEWSGLSHRVDVVEEAEAGDQKTVGRWLRYGSVRIMPLRSHHAPHFDGYTLYQGSRKNPLKTEPRTADQWLDGSTLAYLIDFLDAGGSVAFRVYYQDAVVAPPFGFAPDDLISERPVDVAIFVPATFDQVDWHPEAFVENLRPRWVLLGHWEDFFVPVGEPTHSVPLSDIEHFEDRLTRVFDGPFWRPDIGTEFRFPKGRGGRGPDDDAATSGPGRVSPSPSG
ncbi:MAG: MBL fold metallo-hydrolase [Longimicrobiales bacterium]|nr:MBL fold metallo-hydrolase [Longimicrobiales bacterium]